jgi:Leucine-rich repeat (LRR) protein
MEVRNLPLATLPDSIATQPELTQLVLSNCGISLTAETGATLSSLSQLQVLDLSQNPLGRTFSLQALTNMHYLDLAETGLTTLPPDVLSLGNLTAIILPDNLMTELPPELFDLPANQGRGYDLGGNPYNEQTRNRVKAYFQASREDLGVYAPQADLNRAANLYPLLDREMASDFIYRLPGTLEQGRVELTRLETEYDALTTALAVWTADTPAVHPATGEPLSPEEELIEHNTRDELKRMIEKCWRKETEVDDFNQSMEPSFELVLDTLVIGELPALSADFSYVSHLYLRSRDGLTTVGDGFLRCFPRLKGLTIREYRLGALPESVFRMNQLQALVLPDCEITLTADTVMGLAGMEHLDFLDLAGNPLLLTPDVSQMPDMATLILDQTQISELPRGLLNLTRLDIANLNDNAIFDLPSAIAELPAEVAERINLRGNPLSQRSLGLLLDYFRRTGNDFGVEEVIHLAEMEVSHSDDSTVED